MPVCPYCAEQIAAQARVCPYCQEQIPSRANAGLAQQSSNVPSEPAALNYEFTSAQNEVIATLASAMRFVGVCLIVFAALTLIIAIFALFRSPLEGTTKVIDCIINMIIGFLLLGSAHAFKRIVDTRGNDIHYLMEALIQLRTLYRIQRIIYILAIVLMFVSFIAGIAYGFWSERAKVTFEKVGEPLRGR